MGLRIGLFEDHPMMREVLAQGILTALTENSLHGCVAVVPLTPTEVEQQDSIDLVVMDVDLGPGVNTYEVIRQLRDQGVPTVLVSAAGTPAEIQRCLRAGAISFASKDSTPADLTACINAGLRNETYLTPELAGKLASPAIPDVDLSPEQQRALALCSAGMTRQAIAASLGRTTGDVELLLAGAVSAYVSK